MLQALQLFLDTRGAWVQHRLQTAAGGADLDIAALLSDVACAVQTVVAQVSPSHTVRLAAEIDEGIALHPVLTLSSSHGVWA